ncbi:MAG TPA: hypothetical protein VOA87_10650 [Thermoanaerobaculia bacterium]|nr:hypothetical protein [Thermoanaerobaculia bacterium]
MRNREIEKALQLRNGTLQLFLDGRLDFRVRHLRLLTRVLSVPPADFLELGLPEAARGAQHRLADWIGGAPQLKPAKAPEGGLPQTADELQAMIQKAVTQAIAASRGGAAQALAGAGDAEPG